MENTEIPNRIIRKIKSKAPCFSYGENFNRYPGVITEGHETGCQYKNVVIYIQNGHNNKKDFFEKLIKGISKIQSSRSRKYRLFIFGIGNSKQLQHNGKYFDLNYPNIKSQKKKIIEVFSEISGNKKCSKAIIYELFPKSQGKNFYTSRTKINQEDLLIIIGNKNEVSFSENLKSKLKISIRKHILLIEFDNNELNYIFYPKELNFNNLMTKNNTMEFKRNFNEIKKITNDKLFSDFIKHDCEKENVFMTIRNGYLDFYHKGGRLFKFDKNGFQTHIKYAAVIQKQDKDYLTQNEIAEYRMSIKFDDTYKRIKENCGNYAGIEAIGVSDLYSQHSYLSKSDIVVLDIEISFKYSVENKKQDRIDILLFNKNTKTLQFVEAKHYSNGEIKSKTTPKVIKQIERYKTQINNPTVNSQILEGYKNYINIINEIFNIKLPEPENICKEVSLLIFGFDNDQKNGGLKKIEANLKKHKVKFYAKGDMKSVKIEQLWIKDCNEI